MSDLVLIRPRVEHALAQVVESSRYLRRVTSDGVSTTNTEMASSFMRGAKESLEILLLEIDRYEHRAAGGMVQRDDDSDSVPRRMTTREAILALLDAGETFVSGRAAGDAVGRGDATANEALRRLANEGLAEKVDGRWRRVEGGGARA